MNEGHTSAAITPPEFVADAAAEEVEETAPEAEQAAEAGE